MKINDIISEFDIDRPNGIDAARKISWIADLDQDIYINIMSNFVKETEDEYVRYTENDTDKEVLAPDMYKDMYVLYLESKIDYITNEYERYQNSALAFNSKWKEYVNWYYKNHEHKEIELKI